MQEFEPVKIANPGGMKMCRVAIKNLPLHHACSGHRSVRYGKIYPRKELV
jgi:hypothetical protein